MYYLLLIVVGAVVGALARFIGPGKPTPLLSSILLGVAGSAIGQYFGRLTHFSEGSGSADFVTALVGAMLVVAVYRAVALGRVTR